MRPQQLQENIYWVNNLGQAAALSLYYPVIKIRVSPTNSRLAQFGFLISDNLLKDADSYWAGQLNVDGLGFYNQISKLRSRMYLVLPLKNNNN